MLLVLVRSVSCSFSVGQVKASGRLRVSSTAPYFVDDQLYCPEMDMENCRPLDLRVSLAPVERCDPAAWNDSDQPEGGLSSAAQAAQAVTELPAVTTTTARVEEDPSDSRPTPWVLDICLVSCPVLGLLPVLKKHQFL